LFIRATGLPISSVDFHSSSSSSSPTCGVIFSGSDAVAGAVSSVSDAAATLRAVMSWLMEKIAIALPLSSRI
jgi:hypothetical protein